MAIWLDGITRDPASAHGGSDGGSMLGGPPRGVLHTTEGNTYGGSLAAYVSKNVWPHLTVSYETGRFQAWQHLPLDRASRALRNPAGGVQTNRQGTACVNIEIVGHAELADTLPDGYLTGLAKLMRQIERATGIPRRSTVTWKAYPASYGLSNGVRLSGAAWNAYSGWCGHQHVPENEHGDPGRIDIDALLASQPEEDLSLDADTKTYLDGQFAALHQDHVIILRGDATHPDNLAAIHDDTAAIKQAVAQPVQVEVTLSQADREAIAALVAAQLQLDGEASIAGTLQIGPKPAVG